MCRHLGFLIFLSILSFGVLHEKANPQSLITNKDVVDLVKAGITSEIVVAKIKASPCRFDTSATQLKALKAAGVSDEVILAMVQARFPKITLRPKSLNYQRKSRPRELGAILHVQSVNLS